MARYFFHLLSDGKRFDDEDGTELANDEAAHQEALECAIELICDRLKGGWAQNGRDVLAGSSVEVADGSGAVLLTLPFATAFKPR